jgi:hypothetical protein
MWLTSWRTFHSVQGVGQLHWQGCTATSFCSNSLLDEINLSMISSKTAVTPVSIGARPQSLLADIGRHCSRSPQIWCQVSSQENARSREGTSRVATPVRIAETRQVTCMRNENLSHQLRPDRYFLTNLSQATFRRQVIWEATPEMRTYNRSVGSHDSCPGHPVVTLASFGILSELSGGPSH